MIKWFNRLNQSYCLQFWSTNNTNKICMRVVKQRFITCWMELNIIIYCILIDDWTVLSNRGLFKILISLCEASEKEVYDYCIQVLTLLNEMTIHYDFKKLLQCEDHILSELPTLSLDLNHTLFYVCTYHSQWSFSSLCM